MYVLFTMYKETKWVDERSREKGGMFMDSIYFSLSILKLLFFLDRKAKIC